ncbi:hypothetical protein AMS68_005192 [Peltaster fructicola]|uniref:CSC1/OSCA1-like 7TM region domain-containing protein n=1 Tax=Peltaster fructicola TaxID=286661 RepID=A0A6H0XYE0_9PEZI|nr:hypothetical protein AMS68_005192 [Peltaster fructicola]
MEALHVLQRRAQSCSLQATDKNVGSAQGTSASLSTFISTLVPVIAFAAVWFLLFLIFRVRFPRLYHPRTFLGSLNKHERSPDLPKGMFNWFGAFYNIPDTYVLNHHSLDAYLFLRFLKIAVVSCLVGCCITFPILFPINATGGGGKSQLDAITIANVTNSYFKLFAHAICAIIYFGFILYMITRESIFYINLRQAYLLSPLYSSRLSSRTVLFTSVPAPYMNEGKLRAMFGSAVVRVWFNSNTKELEKLVADRDTAAMKLEGAETKLITTATKNKLKAEKKGGASTSEDAAAETGNISSRYITPKQRPTHKLGKFGLYGKKVDTIDWSRSELQRLIPEIETKQNAHRAADVKLSNSVFIEFTTLTEAQAAFQALTHHQALQMAPRYTGMIPDEIIWSNLGIRWWERVIRQIVTLSIIVALIIFWSIPVAFVGAISNVQNLTCIIPAFGFINSIPSVVLGVVTGLLPSVLLAVLMSLLPPFIRLMARLGGDPTLSAVELTTQNYYFAFQVVQVFLVATLGSAASSSVQTIANNPSSVTSLLATQIPLANNFYLSYFVLQGLGIVSGLLVGLVGLILFFVLGRFLDNTPRKLYKRWSSLSGIGWGTLFPVYANLWVIAICYAVIAPLVLLFAAIGIYLFYFAYRYNLMFVSNATIDTKGLVYPRALSHIFVGLYIAEVCLVGYFAILTGTSVGAIGPLILMILMLIFTALYQISLSSALGPLLNYLPKTLDAEERHLLSLERGEDSNGANPGEKVGSGVHAHAANGEVANGNTGAAPHKKPNFFTKWLRPDVYTDYATMRRMVPKDIEIRYEPAVEHDAYYDPAVKSQTPLLWIPRDNLGISRQEINDTRKVLPITDEGAYLDDKGKIVWDAEDGRPPIYEEKTYY